MKKVLFESGKISKITINRPDKHNALDAETISMLTAYLKKASKDKKCRCIIITGTGGKAFCAGADLKYMSGIRTAAAAGKFFDLFLDLRKEIAKSPKVVIAVIDGYCLGGGNELAIACDMRIASFDSVFGQPEVKHGISPGGGATYVLPQLIGAGRARDMILTGRMATAVDAMGIGLINVYFFKRNFEKRTMEICNQIAECGPDAVALAKSTINKTLAQDYSSERKMFIRSLLSKEGKEGIKAFTEHRKANFATKV